MFEHCGGLGFFGQRASGDSIKNAAFQLDVCGKGTFWNADSRQCVAQNDSYDMFDVAQRDGICECNSKPTLAASREECESGKVGSCTWTAWNDVADILFDVDR